MKSIIKNFPLVKPAYQRIKKAEYRKKFETDCYGCFWGVFETFDQAKQAAPTTKSIGYNDPNLAREYQQMLEQDNWENSGRTIHPYDYPALFWLRSAFSEGYNRVFDFGGNVGIHYYNYSKYLSYPDDLVWSICEFPEIIKVGKELAKSRSAKKLYFTNNFEDINDCDIFIGSGSIQYVQDFSQSLSANKKPQHLMINRLPLYDGEQFVTLQNGGQVFYPQYVFNKTKFIGELQSIGYNLIDLWEDRGCYCKIPFYPEKAVHFYHGMYLKLDQK